MNADSRSFQRLVASDRFSSAAERISNDSARSVSLFLTKSKGSGQSSIPSGGQNQIEHHFTHYKDLKKPGTTKVMGFGDVAKAHEVIAECIERWDKESV